MAPYCEKELAEIDRLKPSSDKAAAVYEFLLTVPAHRACTGRQIIETLDKAGVIFEQSTLTTHLLPQLKAYGLESTGAGYRIPADKRPPPDGSKVALQPRG